MAQRSSEAVRISPVEKDDVPRLVHVHAMAFQSDVFSQFMTYGRPSKTQANMMRKSLLYWLDESDVKIIKASTVSEDGQEPVVGWACWAVKKNEGGHVEQAPIPPSSVAMDQNKKSFQILSQQLRHDTTEWEKRQMQSSDREESSQYLVFQALATHPDYQRRGVAPQLIRHAIQAADAEGLPCWCHASEASWRLYQDVGGFEIIGTTTYDLDEYWKKGIVAQDATQPPNLGNYVFRYMKRAGRVADSQNAR